MRKLAHLLFLLAVAALSGLVVLSIGGDGGEPVSRAQGLIARMPAGGIYAIVGFMAGFACRTLLFDVPAKMINWCAVNRHYFVYVAVLVIGVGVLVLI